MDGLKVSVRDGVNTGQKDGVKNEGGMVSEMKAGMVSRTIMNGVREGAKERGGVGYGRWRRWCQELRYEWCHGWREG